MSTLNVDTWEPESGTAATLMATGDTVTVPSGATLDISAATLTPPATMPASSGVNFTALNATNLGSGTVPTARLGTGTANSTTFLRGDQTYAAAGGGFISYTVHTGNATWTKTDNNPTKVVVEVQGGGGGGGGAYNGGMSGGTGGSGGYCRKFIDVSGIATAAIVVGAAGSAGGHTGAGGAGGTSSWTGGSTLTGSAGNGGAGATISVNGTGGTGGAASGGDINIPGTNGSWAVAGPKSSGGSFLGFPNPKTTGAAGSGLVGLGYGAQGWGGQGPGVYVGGAGTAGVVIVWEYA